MSGVRQKEAIIWIDQDALASLANEASSLFPLETGGVLLGYMGTDGTIVVTDIVGPGPDAKHAKYRFTPDHQFHEAEIARLYADSGRRIIYLGDWHSHPTAKSGNLSFLDRFTLRRIANFADARISSPIMGILFGEPGQWYMTVHQYDKSRMWLGRVKSCAIRPYAR